MCNSSYAVDKDYTHPGTKSTQTFGLQTHPECQIDYTLGVFPPGVRATGGFRLQRDVL